MCQFLKDHNFVPKLILNTIICSLKNILAQCEHGCIRTSNIFSIMYKI